MSPSKDVSPLFYISSRRLLQLGLFLLALFVPFSIAGTNIALGFVALGWITIGVARHLDPSLPRPLPFWRDPMCIASVLLAFSALPSVLMSENYSRAMKDWRSHWQLIIYFGVAANLVVTGMRETFFRALAVSSILSCMFAFVQRAGGLDFWFVHIAAEHRVSSTLYIMTFAGILAQLIVFFAASAFMRGMSRSERVLVVGAVACQILALMFTMTRGAWLALAVGLIALVLMLRNRKVLIASTALLAVLVAFSFLYSTDQNRTLSITALFEQSPDRNVGTRLALWDTAWELFKSHPLLGVGMGDYSTEADRMLSGVDGIRTTVDSHNIPLHILATRGLLGFLPFVFFWITVFRVLAQTRREAEPGSRGRYYAIGATVASVAILVGSLTENNIDDEEVWGAFMVLLGLARAQAYFPHVGRGSAARSSPAPPPQESQ